jgi:hypothetical protein
MDQSNSLNRTRPGLFNCGPANFKPDEFIVDRTSKCVDLQIQVLRKSKLIEMFLQARHNIAICAIVCAVSIFVSRSAVWASDAGLIGY